MKKRIKLAFLLGGLLLGLAIGFNLGRASLESKEEIVYVKGETIQGSTSFEQSKLVKEEKPEQSQLPTKPVVKENLTTQIVDTAAIIAEYELRRSYAVLAFDNNKQGKLELYPTLQYNRLVGLDYNFTPIIQNNRTIRSKVWRPFISGSYSTLDYIGFGGGIFYHNLGFEYQYNIDIRKKPPELPSVSDYFNRGNYHWFSGKYMF